MELTATTTIRSAHISAYERVEQAVRSETRRIERGEIDPTRIITHTLPLDEAEHGFDIVKNKQENCEKVVLKP